MNKYHNKKVIYNGIKFDSEKEKNYYIYLKLLEKAGKIRNLKLQVSYELQPSFKLDGKTIRAITYIADFVYYDNNINQTIIVDVKGMRTEVYKIKKKLFEYKYGIQINEV